MKSAIYILVLHLFFIVAVPNHTFSQGKNLIDSLQLKYEQTTDPGQKLEISLKLSDILTYEDADKARFYGYKAINISNERKDKKALAAAFRNIGVAHEGQGNFDSALYYQRKALQHFSSLGDSIEIAGSYNNIGIVYDVKGDNDIATENYLTAARIYERLEDIDGMAKVYNNLGIIYKKSQQFEKALEYYKKALEIYTLKKHTFGIAVSHNNIGSVYYKLKNYHESLKHSYRAVEMYKSSNILQYLPYAYENIGEAYEALHQKDSALAYHLKALDLYKSYGNKKEMAYTLNNLGEIELKSGNKSKALNYVNESLAVSTEIGANEEQINSNNLLSSVYYSMNDYKKAYDYLNNYVQLKDSIDNVEKSAIIANMQAKYESEKKEQAIKILTAETQVKDIQLLASRNRFIALAIISALILMIGVLITNRRELKQKALLAEERQEQHKKQLIAMVEAEEKERKRIARELHDGIGQQLSGIKMAFETLSEDLVKKNTSFSNKIGDLTKYLHQSSDEVRNLSHQMMPKSLIDLGLLAAIEDLVEKTFKYSHITPSFEHYNVEGRFAENIEITIYRVAQELINNVIKHSGATEIYIQLIKDNDNLRLLVEDNGKGFNKTATDGHGINNIKNRLDMVHGKIFFEDSPDNGIIASVTIPINNEV